MSEAGAAAPALTGRTVWARNLAVPVRSFLGTEVGSSLFLLGAAVAALLWANVDWSSYESFWATELSIRVGEPRDLPGPARLGQQRPDDVLLPRDRARGEARVRRRRPARAAPRDAAAAGRARRADGAGADLPRVQRGRVGSVGLGRGDVDRHGVRAGRARARRALVPRSAPRVHAHRGGRGRPRRPGRDRHRLLARRRVRLSRDRGGAPRGRARAALAGDPARRPLRGDRRGDVAGGLRVGRRAGDRRPRDGPADLRLSRDAARPRARDEPVPLVPRAADAGAGAHRPAEPGALGLAERAAPEPLAPVDELRDRAALRARKRRDPDQPHAPPELLLLVGHARDHRRLRRREAGRDRGRDVDPVHGAARG